MKLVKKMSSQKYGMMNTTSQNNKAIFQPTSSALVSARHVESRGHPELGPGLQNATARWLPRGALQHYVSLLEGQSRGKTHLWVPEECSGRLLHSHREAVPGTALLRVTDRQMDWRERALIMDIDVGICSVQHRVNVLVLSGYKLRFSQ